MKVEDYLPLNNSSINLMDWSLLKLKGDDVLRFLNGQLSQNIELISQNSGDFSARLDPSGRVKYYTYVLRDRFDCFWLLTPKYLSNEIIQDLNKFIIMDDVEISEYVDNFKIYFINNIKNLNLENMISFVFQGVTAFLDFSSNYDFPIFDFDKISFITGNPNPRNNFFSGELVNNTFYNKKGLSLDKGCFVGQEPAAKLNRGRGPSKYPQFFILQDDELTSLTNEVTRIKIGNQTLVQLYEKIGFKPDSKKITQLSILPLKEIDSNRLAEICYLKGVDLFHSGNIDESINLLKTAVLYRKDYIEVLEVLGVISGKINEFQKGISYMDQILKIDPNYVMAFTNKSLFYMKMGKIEEAEREKDNATLASFSKKPKTSSFDQGKLEALKKKEIMFKKVLALDENDLFALKSLSEVLYELQNYAELDKLLDRALDKSETNLDFISMKIKCLEKLARNDEVFDYSVKGMKLAEKSGNKKMINFFSKYSFEV